MNNDNHNKRVIYISYQPYALDFALNLEKELGWKPVLWMVSGGFDKKLKASFPETLTYEFLDAIKGKMPAFLPEAELETVDADLLKSMAVHESIAINMMNRNYLAVTFTYQERFRLYHRQLRLYNTLLNRLNPDYIIFEDTPHQSCNYVLYSLAQKRGIKTILFEANPFIKFFMPFGKFEEGNTKMIREYKEACSQTPLPSFELSELVREELAKVRGDHSSALPFYMVHQVNAFKAANSKKISKALLKYAKLPLKAFNAQTVKNVMNLIGELDFPALHNYYKQEGQKMEESVLTNRDYNAQVNVIKKIKAENIKYYRSIEQKNPNLDVPFIFCPLHYQPEKSSSPWGGYYVNQLLLIEMLAKNIPAGWKVYVKDHITQYLFPREGEACRDKSFYDDILQLPNVEFLPLEMKSVELIDRAVAVASIAGRALWESVLRGKPGLAFGEGHHTWCGGCEGIFYTPTNKALTEALDKIKSGYKVSAEKVELYCHFIEKYSYQGYAGGVWQAKNSGVTIAENGRAHAEAVKQWLGITPVHK